MFFVAAPFKKQRFCGVDEHISKGCGVMCSVGEQIMEKEGKVYELLEKRQGSFWEHGSGG